MPATLTLTTTSLAAEAQPGDRLVKLVDSSGLTTSDFIFCEGELMRVVSLEGATSGGVNVQRGQGGSAAVYHEPGGTCYIGKADAFYSADPVGSPPEVISVSPWINVKNGSIWFAQGDPVRAQYRWWQKQTMVPSQGPLGIRVFTYDPTSST